MNERVIEACWNYVHWFFHHDDWKTKLWFSSKNVLLGSKNIRPVDIIFAGREKTLLKFIIRQIDNGRMGLNLVNARDP